MTCMICGVTTKQQLIEARMGGRRVSDLIESMRKTGASWQQVADAVHDRSGVVVSRESLRKWNEATPSRAA